MHLHRVTPDTFENYKLESNYHGEGSDKFRTDTLNFQDGWDKPVVSQPAVVNIFKRFGGGEKRKSDFEVLGGIEGRGSVDRQVL